MSGYHNFLRISVENPFSILNVLVPEPPSRPQIIPLYPPTSAMMPASIMTTDGAQSQSQVPQPRIHPLIPVTTSSNRSTPVLSTLSNIPTPSVPITSTPASSTRPPQKRRHWTIVRNAPARSRAKDKETDATPDEVNTTWKVPRDAGPTDYGTFATFLGELAASAAGPNMGAVAEYLYGTEHRLFATIRSTVEHRGVKRKRDAEADQAQAARLDERGSTESFWTDERAEEAWDYLRDVVYGGVDGYAYVRSLAEFVAPSVYLSEVRKDTDGRADVAIEDVDRKPPSTPLENLGEALPLGVPLTRYVEDNLVDMVTRGRHRWLRDVLFPAAVDPASASPRGDGPPSSFCSRMSALPGAARAAASFKAWAAEQLDMAALIRKPEELAKEGDLEGGPAEGGEQANIERALMWGVKVIEQLGGHANGDWPGDERGCVDEGVRVKEEVVEDARVAEEEEEEATMDVDPDLDSNPPQSQAKPEPDADTEEDPLIKRLRMNLLALAKRAPLDMIAKLPVELVPESIRAIVPTA